MTARSRTTRPGSWAEGRSRVGAIAPLSPAVSPSRSASSTSNTLPACDTTPVASATTCTLLLHVRRVTFTVILLSGGIGDFDTPILPAQSDVPALASARYRRPIE